jgi:hypothetical protein
VVAANSFTLSENQLDLGTTENTAKALVGLAPDPVM